MTLHPCIDDSGSDLKQPFFVLGGFVATAEQWTAFSAEWKKALVLSPKLDYFKMSEAANFGGQFGRDRGWNESNRDDRIITLVRIIKKYTKARVSYAMKTEHFIKYLQNIPVPGRKLASDHPYSMMFFNLITTVAALGPWKGLNMQCDFIFDKQTGFSDEVLKGWPTYKDIAEKSSKTDFCKLIGSEPTFKDEKDFLPLQAADLYAWQVRRNYTDNQILYMSPSRALLQLLPISGIDYVMDEAEIIRLRDYLLRVGKDFASAYPEIALVNINPDKKQRRRDRKRAKKPLEKKKRGS